jgi:hypothetical protein
MELKELVSASGTLLPTAGTAQDEYEKLRASKGVV